MVVVVHGGGGGGGGSGDWVQFSKLLVVLAEEQTFRLQNQHKYTVQKQTTYWRKNKNYGICICALIVKIQEYTNKCTILQYKVFAVKTLEFWHISTFLVGHP